MDAEETAQEVFVKVYQSPPTAPPKGYSKEEVQVQSETGAGSEKTPNLGRELRESADQRVASAPPSEIHEIAVEDRGSHHSPAILQFCPAKLFLMDPYNHMAHPQAPTHKDK